MNPPFVLRLLWTAAAETIGDFFLFLPWWYTKGLLRTVKGVGRAIVQRQRSLALGLWIANLFKPMYGQEDWQGKIISFVFRVLILFWRVALFFIWILLTILFLIVYFLLPVVALYGVIRNW